MVALRVFYSFSWRNPGGKSEAVVFCLSGGIRVIALIFFV